MKSSKKKAKFARKIRRQLQTKLNGILNIDWGEDSVKKIIENLSNTNECGK